jgi:peptide/nickel transport system permease protein
MATGPRARPPRCSVPRAVCRSVWGDGWAFVAAATILLLFALALGAPLLTALEGQNPFTYNLGALNPATGAPAGALGGVSWSHWFGVEPLTGRDLFAIVAYGARISLLIGIIAAAAAVTIGVVVGVAAGYLGGWADQIASWVINVLLGFPSLIFMIALGALAPPAFPRPLLLILVIAVFGWPVTARIVRAQTLTLKTRGFVGAARSFGAGWWHVFAVDLLPSLWGPIIVVATVSIPSCIGLEAALSFLGVGIPPSVPSWGGSIAAAIGWIDTDPMFLIFPGSALFMSILSFNLMGDKLRDALDPRLGVVAPDARCAAFRR